jgi:two-component sensor histidine kinase
VKERAAAFRLMALYFVIGSLWILFSDKALEVLVPDPDQYAHLQTLKGWFYVAATSVLFGLFAFTELRLAAEMRNKREADEKKIASMLAEKNDLLRELHHRVKNNLQLISSLIYLRMDALPQDETRRFFSEFLLRIRAISLAQDRLYALEDLSGIDLRALVGEVVDELAIQYRDRSVRLAMAPGGTVLVRLDKGIPLSLAVNEVLLNAVAHAFPDGRPGRVTVELTEEGNGILLSVRDDGVGFDPAEVPEGSIGFSLIHILVCQAGGTVEYRSPLGSEGGTEVRIGVQEANTPEASDTPEASEAAPPATNEPSE